MITICGIAGFSLSPLEQIDAHLLAKVLLLEIEERGQDATGAAWFDDKGVCMVQKSAMKASWFVRDFAVPEYATNVILHTRYGTKGSETNNDNNHPVVTGGVVGVHNGCIWGDDDLFKQLKRGGVERIAEVDTEAAFAAIAYGTTVVDEKPLVAATLEKVLSEIGGSAALAWQNVGEPDVLHLTRVYQSPLVIAFTEAGSIFFASTGTALRTAAAAVEVNFTKTVYADEGEYFKVVNGEVVEQFDYEPESLYYRKSWSDSYSRSTVFGTGWGGTTTVSTRSVPSTTELPATEAIRNANLSPSFNPFINPTSLQIHVEQMFEKCPPPASDDQHYDDYEHRELAIERYMKTFEIDDSFTLNKMGALYRVGHLVRTDVPGYDKPVQGHIVLMPQSFPTGSFIIRALVPNNRYQTKMEPILVSRALHEFVVLSPSGRNSVLATLDQDDETSTETSTEIESASASDTSQTNESLIHEVFVANEDIGEAEEPF